MDTQSYKHILLPVQVWRAVEKLATSIRKMVREFKDERGSSPDTDEAVELGFWHPLGVAAVCLWKR